MAPNDVEAQQTDVELCTRCTLPVPAYATRCPHCDEPIGSSVMLPFEGIHAEWTFIGRALKLLPAWTLKPIAALTWGLLAAVLVLVVWQLVTY
jgi:hypothetical protein